MEKYYLVEFENKSLDIVDEASLICDLNENVVGSSVTIMFPCTKSGKKLKEFSVKILKISSK